MLRRLRSDDLHIRAPRDTTGVLSRYLVSVALARGVHVNELDATGRAIAKMFRVPDHIVGIPTPWWRRWWQRHVTRRL